MARSGTLKALLLLGAMSIWLSCSNNTTPTTADSFSIDRNTEGIFLTDRTGKKWDITHAEKKYGMKADRFQFGLGPFAIPPILNPQYYSPGENGYPNSFSEHLVIGVNLWGVVAAYPIQVMSAREIVDETFNGHHAAVAY
ncbi:MAG: hypothetical protein Kow0037_11480 [Calditrichia bacterium]